MTTGSRMFLNQVQLWQMQEICLQLDRRIVLGKVVCLDSGRCISPASLSSLKKPTSGYLTRASYAPGLFALFYSVLKMCSWSQSSSVKPISLTLYHKHHPSLRPSLSLSISFRYIYYFGGLLSGAIKMNSSPLFLHQVLIPSLPNFQGEGGVIVCFCLFLMLGTSLLLLDHF